MTRNPVTVGPETPVEQALERMLAGNFRHLPVTEGERVVLVGRRPHMRIASEHRDRSTGEFGVWLGSPGAPVRSCEGGIEHDRD